MMHYLNARAVVITMRLNGMTETFRVLPNYYAEFVNELTDKGWEVLETSYE